MIPWRIPETNSSWFGEAKTLRNPDLYPDRSLDLFGFPIPTEKNRNGLGTDPFLRDLRTHQRILRVFRNRIIQSCTNLPPSKICSRLVWLKCFFSVLAICIFPFYCLCDRGNDKNTKRVLDMYFISTEKNILFAGSDTTNEMDSIFTQWNNEAPKTAILRISGNFVTHWERLQAFHVTFLDTWRGDGSPRNFMHGRLIIFRKSGPVSTFFCRSSLNSSSFLVDPFPIGLKHVFTMSFFVGRFVRDDWYVLCIGDSTCPWKGVLCIGDSTCPFPWTSVCSACHLQHCLQRRTSSIGLFQLEKIFFTKSENLRAITFGHRRNVAKVHVQTLTIELFGFVWHLPIKSPQKLANLKAVEISTSKGEKTTLRLNNIIFIPYAPCVLYLPYLPIFVQKKWYM